MLREWGGGLLPWQLRGGSDGQRLGVGRRCQLRPFGPGGGSYDSPAQYISSATRAILVGTESLGTSFRVARTLASH